GLKRIGETIVQFDRDQSFHACIKERAREAARTGADLDHRLSLNGACRRCNASKQDGIEQEVLAERLLGEGLRQGRASAAALARAAAMLSARCSAAIRRSARAVPDAAAS